jgi:hypothetical protein
MELRWSELPNTILRIGIPAEIVRVTMPGLILVEIMLSGKRFANFLYIANILMPLRTFLDRLCTTERLLLFKCPAVFISNPVLEICVWSKI